MAGSQLRQQLDGARVALVHDWLSSRSGSEKTFEQLARLLPDADLYSLSRNDEVPFDFGGREVHTSLLDAALRRGGRGVTLPVMPWAWRQLARGRRYDVVITSSHSFCRAFAAHVGGLHLSYTYTPARYLWHLDIDERGPRLGHPQPVLKALRRLDQAYARSVRSFAAISSEVRRRIRAVYGRDASVVFPPVDTDFFRPEPARRGDFVLAVSRLIPYKRLDLAIHAAQEVGVDLVVVGTGPDRPRLEALARRSAGARVEFAGAATDAELRSLYSTARAVIFPAHEDFGIVPVEAQACGTPVVALARGGSLDTVRPAPGSHVRVQTAEGFGAGLRRCLDARPDHERCRAHAERFSVAAFEHRATSWVQHGVACEGR